MNELLNVESIQSGANIGPAPIKAAGIPELSLLNQNKVKGFTYATCYGGPGIGGIGVTAAGGQCKFNLDIGDLQGEVHRRNWDAPYVQMDAMKASPESISDYIVPLGHSAIGQSDLDALLLSPCCQDISIANPTKTLFSPRNKLLLDCVRLIGGDTGFRPKMALVENVFNLANPAMSPLLGVFLNLCDSLTDYYYELGVYNSLDFMTPQPRRRILIQFVRKDIGRPVWPKATTVDYSSLNLNAVLPYVEGFRISKNKTYTSANQPINTITTGGRLWVKLIDGTERLLTVDEGKLLSTVPTWFNLEGIRRSEAFLLLGNAIMPNFIQPFFEIIRDELLS
jgi:site-specific DNA-cytosine methylase